MRREREASWSFSPLVSLTSRVAICPWRTIEVAAGRVGPSERKAPFSYEPSVAVWGVPGSFRSQPGQLSIPSALMDSAEARLLQLGAARGQERRQRPKPLPLVSATVTGRSATPLCCLPPLSGLQTPSREYSQHYGGGSEKEQGRCIWHQECSEYVGSVRLG